MKKILCIVAIVLILAILIPACIIAGSMDGRGEPTGEVLIVLGTTVNGTEPSPMLKQRLDAALSILRALEANEIVGEAASVDVTRLEDIILWYGTRYQVNLGGIGNMEYKIACMNDTILQLSDYQTGVLDVSFNFWKEQVGYTPFE